MYPSDSCNLDRSEDRLTASHEAAEEQSSFRFVRTDEIAVVFLDRTKSRELKKEVTKTAKQQKQKLALDMWGGFTQSKLWSKSKFWSGNQSAVVRLEPSECVQPIRELGWIWAWYSSGSLVAETVAHFLKKQQNLSTVGMPKNGAFSPSHAY